MGNFASRLKEMREKRGLSQAKLAELCNSSEVVMRGYEKSRRMPQADMLIRICNALKVSPDFLLQDELAVNPYDEKNEIVKIVDNLTNEQFEKLKDFLNSL